MCGVDRNFLILGHLITNSFVLSIKAENCSILLLTTKLINIAVYLKA